MKHCLFAALLLTAAQPCFAAEDFNWRRESDQVRIRNSLQELALFCVTSFGFTRVATLTDAELKKKLTAHLLLVDSVDLELGQWEDFVAPMGHFLDKKALAAQADRAADAYIAADTDPTSIARAETFFVSMVMGPVRTALRGCERAANTNFIKENFFTGKGSADKFEVETRAMFAEDMKSIKK